MVAKKRNKASMAVFAMLMWRQSNPKLERKDQLSELGMDGSQSKAICKGSTRMVWSIGYCCWGVPVTVRFYNILFSEKTVHLAAVCSF
jgi:hypothetical protein